MILILVVLRRVLSAYFRGLVMMLLLAFAVLPFARALLHSYWHVILQEEDGMRCAVYVILLFLLMVGYGARGIFARAAQHFAILSLTRMFAVPQRGMAVHT